jgi:acyl-CoA dehydrogenase
VRITQRLNPAREPIDEVTFTAAPCIAQAANPFPQLAEPVITLGAVAKSAMMTGALEWALEQAVQYAIDRVQFGKPIGKNQAIQQQLAQLAGDVAAARMAAMLACDDAPDVASRDCAATLFSAAVAKIRIGESATRATSIVHQVHGAIGFTYEHHLNYATRRLWAWREASGADAWWAERLGRAAIESRAAGFWPSITNKHFASL